MFSSSMLQCFKELMKDMNCGFEDTKSLLTENQLLEIQKEIQKENHEKSK